MASTIPPNESLATTRPLSDTDISRTDAFSLPLSPRPRVFETGSGIVFIPVTQSGGLASFFLRTKSDTYPVDKVSNIDSVTGVGISEVGKLSTGSMSTLGIDTCERGSAVAVLLDNQCALYSVVQSGGQSQYGALYAVSPDGTTSLYR